MRLRWISMTALLVVLAGCESANPGFYVSGLIASSDECVLEPSEEFLAAPAYDVLLDSRLANDGVLSGYQVGIQIQNTTLSRAQTIGVPRADPSTVLIEGVEVELRDVTGSLLDFTDLPNPYTVLANGVIPPGQGGMDAAGAFLAKLIPPVYAERFLGQLFDQNLATPCRDEETGVTYPCDPADPVFLYRVIARDIIVVARPFGTTVGGVSMEAGDFRFPLEISRNRLSREFLTCTDPDAVYSACTPGSNTGGSCESGS